MRTLGTEERSDDRRLRPATCSVRLKDLRELWVHTGTACNLSCTFCHEGSKPGDTRIAAPTLAQLAPYLDEAAARGVERFAFTGGEPLILKGIAEILLYALRLRPVLVLTNGTAPFIRRAHHLAMLREAPHPLAFRVSIDYPDEARHDAQRGLKNFRKALEGLKLLHAAGFEVGVTRQRTRDENAVAVDERMRALLRKHRLPEDLRVISLPDLGALDDIQYSAGGPAEKNPGSVHPEPACVRSRMLVVRDAGISTHACPLTDDNPRFSTGSTLEEAVAARVMPVHPRCAQCLGPGVDYAGTQLPTRAIP